MPKILIRGKYTIVVYPSDHPPVHCHVKFDSREIRVFLPSYRWEYVSKKMALAADIEGALALVKDSKNEIGKIWRKLHGN